MVGIIEIRIKGIKIWSHIKERSY